MSRYKQGQTSGAGYGIEGYDWPAEWEPALQAGAARGCGVAVVAGTSNNRGGRDRQGREGRVTGCGPRFGEYGGASEIVSRAVKAVSLAQSRRGPATRLERAFAGLVDAVDVADLLEGLALDRYRLSHLAAPVVFEEAMKGDPVVHEIVSWAGSEPGGLVVGVIRQLGFEGIPFELILAGSLYDGSPALAEALMATEHAAALQAFLIRLAEPPVIGGVLPGMEQAHAQTADLCPVLIDSTRKMLAILSG